MDAQPLFRGSMAIIEQPNGYYEVHIGRRWDLKGSTPSTVYPNLSWAEVGTLVEASLDDWSTERAAFHQVVLTPLWDQLTLDV